MILEKYRSTKFQEWVDDMRPACLFDRFDGNAGSITICVPGSLAKDMRLGLRDALRANRITIDMGNFNTDLFFEITRSKSGAVSCAFVSGNDENYWRADIKDYFDIDTSMLERRCVKVPIVNDEPIDEREGI